MRRLIIEEPYAKSAVISRRLALFALVVAIIGIGAARSGLDPAAAFAILGGAAGAAIASVLCACLAFVVIWRSGAKGAGAAFAGLGLAVLLLAYPVYLLMTPRRAAVADLTTDLVDPPAFSLSRPAQAARGDATPRDIAASVRAGQAHLYPQIQPILLDLDVHEAYAAILKAIAAVGWRIVEQTPPGGRSGIGHVDAIARSFMLGFPIDVTLRIRPLAGQTRVDVRSVSRFDRYDFGANQNTIGVFESALETQVDKK
ncbi:DUF1499 domain-containing protein [Methylocapsa palsarum]|uniref:DUF1499 domain-containing protein n=1 Tax=Methylocapsa palsarum TaxID=1612308 RepID=A0A1I3X5Z3_9HYPH|nr:DUF1499 domain-containing protein [Methylocapsa palsarum]SFK14286.1 Protein of unknown function [Methylocapsa palsarum]